MTRPRGRSRIHPGDGDPRHGTTNGYCNLRCRCQDCRRAWTDYRTAHKAEMAPLAPDDERHGKYTTYNNHGCRCRPCTDAESAHTRTWRQLAGAR